MSLENSSSFCYQSWKKHLENLLTIRPVGVVSKKLMGALRMFFMRVSWRLIDAFTVPKVMTMMARKVKRLWRPPKTP